MPTEVFLHTAADKGSPQVLVEKAFTTPGGRVFVILRRIQPYQSAKPNFLGEITRDMVRKRLPDGLEEAHRKVLVYNQLPEAELQFLKQRSDDAVTKLPLFGMKGVKSIVGAKELTFLNAGERARLIGQTIYKMVSATAG